MTLNKDIKISVIGLGYVGLPLAIELSKIYNVFGFDINNKRTLELNDYNDSTGETSKESLKKALSNKLTINSNNKNLKSSDIFIITVPTPITEKKVPDLSFLLSACELVGKYLLKGNVVILKVQFTLVVLRKIVYLFWKKNQN